MMSQNPTITKFDTEMFQGESCKPIYCGVKSLKFEVTSHKNIAGVGIYILVSAGL